MKKLCILIVSCLLIEQAENPHTANAQGSFQDLDFESANLSPIPVNEVLYYVRITSALPGWSAYLGTTPDTQILQNDYTLGEASVDIFGPGNNSGGIGSINGIIDGNYSLMLQAGGTPTGTGSASIVQNGLVPANTQSIDFKAWNAEPNTGILTLSFAGNSLSPVVIGSGPNYTLYGADISAFAGQTGDLEFTSVFNSEGASWFELDDITFSPAAVPEPSALALVVLGGMALAAHHWRAKRP